MSAAYNESTAAKGEPSPSETDGQGLTKWSGRQKALKVPPLLGASIL
jgi:hypothetical protein